MSDNDRAQLRKSAGLTQVKLARLAGIPQSRVSSWENEETELAPEVVLKIARAIQKRLGRAPHFKCVDDLAKALNTVVETR